VPRDDAYGAAAARTRTRIRSDCDTGKGELRGTITARIDAADECNRIRNRGGDDGRGL